MTPVLLKGIRILSVSVGPNPQRTMKRTTLAPLILLVALCDSTFTCMAQETPLMQKAVAAGVDWLLGEWEYREELPSRSVCSFSLTAQGQGVLYEVTNFIRGGSREDDIETKHLIALDPETGEALGFGVNSSGWTSTAVWTAADGRATMHQKLKMGTTKVEATLTFRKIDGSTMETTYVVVRPEVKREIKQVYRRKA